MYSLAAWPGKGSKQIEELGRERISANPTLCSFGISGSSMRQQEVSTPSTGIQIHGAVKECSNACSEAWIGTVLYMRDVKNRSNPTRESLRAAARRLSRSLVAAVMGKRALRIRNKSRRTDALVADAACTLIGDHNTPADRQSHVLIAVNTHVRKAGTTF